VFHHLCPKKFNRMQEQMVRKIMRKPAVLAATGFSNSSLYEKIAAGKFPKPTKLDPDGRSVVWFEDQIEDFQKAAVQRQQAAA
jgi:prophage regulatory protein